ncbi:hypothetical protein [Mesorhizobium sp. M2C.T.Ca.TU.002.02.1.1]|jgi:hypothetical protein|uniref:hypothetical protein n=1 Tax=Mesorhizobium sp. M2C.T.Ca.TU.002.02.1.1 TaxID=2496788 RepID=UPI001FE1016E|nr:hypothetical protein [Mesorhizobium sp. M2C.T.Ca.TU.002.02.1.1]
MARLSAILDRAKSEDSVSETVDSKDAATVFPSLVQGLGFQFAIARVQGHIQPEAERSLAFYLQGLMSGQAATDRAWATIETAKKKRRSDVGEKRRASATAGKVPH